MSPESKQKAALVLFLAKKAFHWGFIPTVLYLGFKKGNDPGMPELSLLRISYVATSFSYCHDCDDLE